jgi:hypothetical protein
MAVWAVRPACTSVAVVAAAGVVAALVVLAAVMVL